MKFTNKKNIIKYLNIAIIIFIFIFLFLGIFFNIKMRKNLESNVTKSLKKDSQIIAKEITSYFIRYGEIANQMLTNEDLTYYIKENKPKSTKMQNPNYKKVVDTLKRIKSTDKDIFWSWLAIYSGNDLVNNEYSSEMPNNYTVKNRPWYTQVVENNSKTTYTNPYKDTLTGEWVISAIAPVLDKNNIIGFAGIDVNIKQIKTYLDSYPIGNSGNIVLISNNGTIIYEKCQELSPTTNLTKEKGILGEIGNKMLIEKTGVQQLTYKNEEKYFAYSSIEINGWSVGTIISKEDTKSQVNLFNMMSIIIFGASTVILIILASIIKLNNNYNELDELYGNLSEKEKELESSNQEISATYQQLLTSEEELRAQYDEIQSYTEIIQDLKQKYEIAIESTNSAIWEINLEDEMMFFSNEIEGILGISFNSKEKVDKVLDRIFSIEDKENFMMEFTQYKRGEIDEIYTQAQVLDKEGNFKWLLFHGRGINTSNKKSKLINGILLDITKLKEQEKHIKYLAYNDILTGLPNRRSFMERIAVELTKHKFGAVMMLDIDNFKGINDTLGHTAGDILLKKVTKELIKLKDENLFISRFGGDEFIILVSGENDILKIEKYAKKIVDIFKHNFVIDNDKVYVSCSIGITLYPTHSNTVNQLIMNADMAMYKVKESGKNNYTFFNEEMTNKLKEKTRIQNILRDSLKKDGFKLVYQPQVDTYTGEIVGFEALLRLKKHSLSPAIFIPLAEEMGIIPEIGRWVTKQAIQQIAIWKKKGFDVKPVAINFSAIQLNDKNYLLFLQNVLKENMVEPSYIDIEITESIFLEKKEETIEFLNQLRALGIKISLDDFGTGYSSLSYLTFLPVDKIKLDKSLSDKFLQKDNIAVMDSIVSLAHSLKLEVVAEGVEYIEQYKPLKAAGCNYIQGFLFSKPLEVDEAEKMYYHNFLEKYAESEEL
ncbi:EAL domain-containing protein [Clostridium tagluense]|uniref:bifunctional diguanylate cyclase/phosphodiesterase n=1 Tax=Clostridium tagluense TaxID=360422 RepID=UPI001CF21C51|nr:EAL domain-containing protein [Clostridium tagluense]MCB2309712.1 EAL domain-containing protein [Clostridium tagluense]MCB2314758.1 EAL domain-containing protein [Clostridium tagluense]MCB2319607.1 EAL domain-containing protein [Clostridium tagluense]MCB2324306.1 EAL domain-containing protein [Clostridium tagluense]MCB2329157.1 EAL domain-containing protein [Clostridium tagluense]